MTQDYKTRSGPRPTARRRHGRSSCVWWFLLGTMLGSFGVGMAWMLQSPPPGASLATTTAGQEAGQSTREKSPKTQFKFYDILPDTRVDVPREEPARRPPPLPPPPRTTEQVGAAPAPASKPPIAPSRAASGSYLLQIGSFRRSADADSQKAKLALLGVQARISTAQVNGVTYHRIIAGPYPGKQQAEQVRAQLSRGGLDSFTTKVK